MDWNTWKRYKANLHVHTRYSDASISISDSVEGYYSQGYDILAVADHGVINRGWNVVPKMVPVLGYRKFTEKQIPLSEERYKEITTGADRGGRGMLDVDRGIELNAAVLRKNHVNGYFCEFGQGMIGKECDYESPVAGVHKAGGLSFINHPGDFIKSHKDAQLAREPENVKLFGNILLRYNSCVGMEVFNRVDSVTRGDRILWDNILQYTIPRGRNVWGFSNDDSHNANAIGNTAEYFMMPELTNEALRTAMENGTFFACAKKAKNEMGEDFVGTGEYAVVKNIIVDEENSIITIEAEGADKIEWIANEKILCEGASINVNDYKEDITCYVRAQLKNEGGIVLTQPFICDDGKMSEGIDINDWRRPMAAEEIAAKCREERENRKIILIYELIKKAVKK